MQLKAEKPIKLEDLDPKFYLLWAHKATATFIVAKVLPIVDGSQPKPYPDLLLAAMSAAQRKNSTNGNTKTTSLALLSSVL
jgi:hypothetical protein